MIVHLYIKYIWQNIYSKMFEHICIVAEYCKMYITYDSPQACEKKWFLLSIKI